jgi:hypothetical protein
MEIFIKFFFNIFIHFKTSKANQIQLDTSRSYFPCVKKESLII